MESNKNPTPTLNPDRPPDLPDPTDRSPCRPDPTEAQRDAHWAATITAYWEIGSWTIDMASHHPTREGTKTLLQYSLLVDTHLICLMVEKKGDLLAGDQAVWTELERRTSQLQPFLVLTETRSSFAADWRKWHTWETQHDRTLDFDVEVGEDLRDLYDFADFDVEDVEDLRDLYDFDVDVVEVEEFEDLVLDDF